MIYLDYAATTPMSDRSLDVFNKVAKNYYGNSMSLHDFGSKANDLLGYCRSEIAQAINGVPEGVIFTSGGSESNVMALYGLAMAYRTKGKHILTIKGEHGSVKSTLTLLESKGFEIEYIPVDEHGLVNVKDVLGRIREETILVTLAHVNGEIGVIQDIEKIGTAIHEKGILFHVDAIQSFGRIPIDIKGSWLSSLAISSHKLYGPKGVGVCYIDPSLNTQPLLPNISHEKGLRQGTVNVPGIAAFTEAVNDAMGTMKESHENMALLKKRMIGQIKEKGIPTIFESESDGCLPHIMALRVKGVEGQWLMLEANRRGLAISTGSACSVNSSQPSQTLMVMGRSAVEARELVRLSFGKPTTEAEIDQAVSMLSSCFVSFTEL